MADYNGGGGGGGARASIRSVAARQAECETDSQNKRYNNIHGNAFDPVFGEQIAVALLAIR